MMDPHVLRDWLAATAWPLVWETGSPREDSTRIAVLWEVLRRASRGVGEIGQRLGVDTADG